jgi:acetyl-CoA acetyltransferase
MRDVSIIGVGRTSFSREGSYMELGAEAVKKAIADIKSENIFRPDDIEICYHGCTTTIGNAGQMALASIDMLGPGIYNVENGFITGITALNSAWQDVAAGLHDIVLVFGAGNFREGEKGALTLDPLGKSWQLQETKGPPFPRFFAQLTRRYMKEYGITREQLAKVAVKNRKNGTLNPQAMFREEVTVDEVLNSEMTVDPLTEYMCCPMANGGAALILCDSKRAKYYQDQPVKIAACAITSGKAGVPYLESAYEATTRAAREAYRMVDPFFRTRETIDVAQIHDFFSTTELIGYEALGLCNRGGGGKLVDEGVTELGGDLPVNTDGGAMSNGYVLGASDLAQVIECVYQLRGQAGDRQVPDAKWALTHIMGSGGSGFCGGFGGRGFGPGGGYAVTVLQKQG